MLLSPAALRSSWSWLPHRTRGARLPQFSTGRPAAASQGCGPSGALKSPGTFGAVAPSASSAARGRAGRLLLVGTSQHRTFRPWTLSQSVEAGLQAEHLQAVAEHHVQQDPRVIHVAPAGLKAKGDSAYMMMSSAKSSDWLAVPATDLTRVDLICYCLMPTK